MIREGGPTKTDFIKTSNRINDRSWHAYIANQVAQDLVWFNFLKLDLNVFNLEANLSILHEIIYKKIFTFL